MAKPIIDVNQPQDSDIIGQGAEAIRETRQQIYDLFPIGPDDLDYNDTSNWWPAGSLTGGFDPDVESGAADPHPDMQDRYALVGQQVAVWDWQMPDDKNILTIGLDTGTATVTEGTNTNWVNIENDDKVEPMRLHDLMDVYLGTIEPEDDDVLIYNDAMSQWVNRPRSSLAADGAPGADGKGWTGTTVLQNDATTYIIRFDSAYPELVFDTDNLRGPAGADGISAYDQWIAEGNTGTEQDFLDSLQGSSGANGADGDSAYEIALDNGFQGTEQEWLDSLVGDQGEPGADGHGLNFQGEVADEASLPGTANEGDTYKTLDTGHLWVYTENGDWLDLGAVEGAPGADGASAYEVAVANGFVGTEAQWLASLEGEDGVTPTIVAGTATKLDHQAAPTVTLTAIGNDTYQYDFGIPAGEPGDDATVDLTPIENRLDDLETDVSGLKTDMIDAQSDISDIQAEQISQNTSIDEIISKNDEQDARLDDLESDVADNASAIEVNANAIADIQNIQGGANTVPDPIRGGDLLVSNDDLTYGWQEVDIQPLLDLRDEVNSHGVILSGDPDDAADDGLVGRVEDLESRLGTEDPADHVTQEELSDALYGAGHNQIDGAVDGVYGVTNALTALVEDNSQAIDNINTVTIPELDGRVTQNEDDIAALQTSTGDNATAISNLEGRVSTNEGDIAQNTTDIGLLEGRVTVNEGDIDQNTTDIGLLDGRVTDNEGDISTNTTNISTNASDISAIKAQLTPGSHETILTSVDNGDGTFSTTWAPNEHIDDELPDTSTANEGDILALVDNAGTLEPEWIVQPEAMDLSNTDPWTHGQYSELYVPTITNDGTVGARVTLDLHVQNNVHLKPTAGSICSVFIGNQPTNFTGMYAHITLDMNSTYVFDETKFNMGTTTYENLENDFHLSFLAEDGIWHCVGMSYVGADAVVDVLQDAPEDGKQYARQDGGWTEVEASGPSGDIAAWVRFNGTGTVSIYGSANVSSITDNGTGDYTVNLTNAMPDANYSTFCSAAVLSSRQGSHVISHNAGSYQVISDQSGTLIDNDNISTGIVG